MNDKLGVTGSKSRQILLPSLRSTVLAFIGEEEGVTAIEYALLGALIAVAIVTGVGAVGANLNALWSSIADAVGQAVS